MSLQILSRPASVARYCPGSGFDFCAAVQFEDFIHRPWTLKAVDPNAGTLVNIGAPVVKPGGLVSTITDYNYAGGSIYDETDTLRSGTAFNIAYGGYGPTNVITPDAGWYFEVDLTLALVTGDTGCAFTYRYPLTGFVNNFAGDFDAKDFDNTDFFAGFG